MKVIIAKINGSPGIEETESSAIYAEIEEMGLVLPIEVFSQNKLSEVLESSKEEEYLLFSNFPPNSSYPGSGKSINIEDKGSYYDRSWEADSYTESIRFFSAITKKYRFKAIHFLTGAPISCLSDELLKSFSAEIITVKRRRDFMTKVSEYPRLYRQYLIEKIKETIAPK